MRRYLEFLAAASVDALVRLVPRRLVLASGSALGRVSYGLDGPHRRLALTNLRAAFPLRSEAECRAIAQATFAHFGRLSLDLLKFSALSRDRLMELVELEGAEHVEHAHARGRGVLFYSGHFGFWGPHSIIHAVRFQPIAVLVREMDNPGLDRLLRRALTCTGNTVFYRRGAMRRVLRELEANRGVGLLIDQHVHSPNAVSVDFFNRPAATTSAIAVLALRTGAPVLPLFALPLPGGRYRMIYEHPIEPPPKDEPDAVREFTQRCTDVLEMYVRRYPDLWMWMHRRWRDVQAAAEPVGDLFQAEDEPAEAETEEELKT